MGKTDEKIDRSNGEGLIPVHIGIARDETHFYLYDKEAKKWIRGNEIPEILNRMYHLPPAKSCYK